MAKWRRWTDPQARPLRQAGPSSGGAGMATLRARKGCAMSGALMCMQTRGFSCEARDCLLYSHPPLWSICVQVSRGPVEWSHRCLSCCQQGGRPRPLLHSTSLRVRPSKQGAAPCGAALLTLPSGTPLLTTGQPSGASPQGSASSSRNCPPCPTLVRASSGPGFRGFLGVSKLYMSPSAFNTACLLPATMWIRRWGTSVLPLHPQFPQRRLSGSRLFLRKGPCKYVHSQARASGGCPEPIFHALTCTMIF